MVVAEPRQTYIMWFSQRVGSTLLSQALEDTGVAGRPREFFVGPTIADVMAQNEASTALELRDRLWADGSTPNGVMAIKYGMYPRLHRDITQLMTSILANRSEEDERRAWDSFFPNSRHFFLTRHDKVSLAVSWWRAIKSGEWHRPSRAEPTAWGRPPEPRSPPREDQYNFEAINNLVAEAREREDAIRDQLDRWDIKPHVVVYEELIARFESTVREVLGVLQLGHSIAISEPAFAPLADAVSRIWRERFLDDLRRRSGSDA
jgi:trehalose 2-sulfotransferase